MATKDTSHGRSTKYVEHWEELGSHGSYITRCPKLQSSAIDNATGNGTKEGPTPQNLRVIAAQWQ
jgi:hypothetical protein